MKKDWKVLKSEIAYDNKWIKVIKDSVELPSGVIIDDYFTSELKSVVMVFALTSDNQVIFVRQYRHGTREVLLELPAGVYEPDQSTEEMIKEELLQETGYQINQITSLGRIVDNPTKDRHHIDLFLAKDVEYKEPPKPESTEDIEVVLIPIGDVLNEIKKGNILVSGSITCILKALLALDYGSVHLNG